MTIYFSKERQHWRYDFVAMGVRYTGYCCDAEGKPVASKSAAKQAEGVEKRKAAIAPRVASTQDVTLAQMMAKLKPTWERQNDWPNKKRYMRELLAHFGSATPIADIGETEVAEYVNHARRQSIRIWTGGPRNTEAPARRKQAAHKIGKRRRSDATVNLHLHMLRQVFTAASALRDPITKVPVISSVPRVPILKTLKRKARPVPEDVLTRVLTIVPQHIVDAMRLTLYFGLRQTEALQLKTHHVDFHGEAIRLYAEDVKDKEDAFLPGGPAAMEFLTRLVAQARERGLEHLISYQPRGKDKAWRPIKSPKTAWATAMRAVKAEFGARWRWHDIRASFITDVAVNSGPVAAQSLARHSDYETTKGYIEVADEIRRNAADRTALRPALNLVEEEKSHTDVPHRKRAGKR